MGDLMFSGDIVVYIVSIAVMWGGLLFRIKALEKKMDKHNCLIERMTKVETRLDGIDKYKEA